MDSTIFDLEADLAIAGTSPTSGNPIISFEIPTLPAYAIDYSDLEVNGLGSHKEGIDYEFNGDKVIWNDPSSIVAGDKVRLIIYYFGIRDYKLLFPKINPPALRKRLSEFYEEAEKNFQHGAWLSYALMCGAIYEGLLFGTLRTNAKFVNLINDALRRSIIDAPTETIMNKARNFDERQLEGSPAISMTII